MTLYRLPDDIRGLVFDIDSTLYSNLDYNEEQRRVLVERLAAEQGRDTGAVESEIEAYQRAHAREHQGQKPSLGNTFLAFGVAIATSVHWREELLRPEAFLRPDHRLERALDRLAARYGLIAVTNNPVSIGRRTLSCLGVGRFFSTVIGLDTAGVSKPHERPFRLAAQSLRLPANTLVSIGDRYEVDLESPLAMGMGGILVEEIEDIYSLPDVLLRHLS